MAAVSMRELLEAGVHFGHQTRRWDPKMRRFIFGERGGIYIINLEQTLQLLEEAAAFSRNLAERGGTILFVGTKKQAQDSIEEHAKRVGMPYVNHRWLGGLLTNWRTISSRIDRLHELRRLKEEGQLDLLPPKERISMLAELERLESHLGGVADMKRQPDALLVVDLRKEAIAVREAQQARPARGRARRHELRPGRGGLRRARQRRRDQVLRPRDQDDRRRDGGREAEGEAGGVRPEAGSGSRSGGRSRRPKRRRRPRPQPPARRPAPVEAAPPRRPRRQAEEAPADEQLSQGESAEATAKAEEEVPAE